MAFPTASYTDSDTTGAGQVPSLGSFVAGNLVIVFHYRNSATAVTASTGWTTLLATSGATTGGGIWARMMDGSANDTLTLTGGNADGCNIAAVVPGARGIPSIASTAITTSSNSNPPNLAPGLGSLDFLWIVVRFSAGSIQATAAPANFGNFRTQQPASGAARLATADRQFNASSLDPGTFTSASTAWLCSTLAVAPAPTPPLNRRIGFRRYQHQLAA